MPDPKALISHPAFHQLANDYPDTNRDKVLLLTELQVAIAEDYQTAVVLLITAVGLVLLIACGNVASLLLARGTARRPELCVRAALGASPSRMVRQLLTESMVTATAGGALGTALAVWFQRLILHVVPVDVPGTEGLGVSWSMLAFALVVSVATGLLFGVLHAVQAARLKIVSKVRSGAGTTDARGQRFHSCLVVAQVAVSLILLIGSGLLLRSFATLRARQRITSHFGTPIHPVWLRCSSVIYLDIIHSSRLARRAPRRPKM